MRHQKRIIKIGSNKAHRKSMLQNLAMNLVIHEKIKTTATRAKAVQPFVERLIGIAKKQDNKMHTIRELMKLVNHEDCSKKLMNELTEKYKDRSSGYTRITKLGNRPGDNAPVVQIELV